MHVGTVYNALISTLTDSPTLEYIKHVFKGIRQEIEPEGFPCIFVEPTSNGELEREMNNVSYQYLDVTIKAYSQNFTEPENNIVGNIDRKGILDIDNDLRAVLADSYQLGCRSIDIKCQSTVFDYSLYPNRGLTLPIKILYKQTNNV